MLLSFVILRHFVQKSAKQHYLVDGKITAAKIVSELTATEKEEKKWPWLKVVSRNTIKKKPSHTKKTANSIIDYPRKC